jgi:hypothetical protein
MDKGIVIGIFCVSSMLVLAYVILSIFNILYKLRKRDSRALKKRMFAGCFHYNLNSKLHVALDEKGEKILREHFQSNNIDCWKSNKFGDGWYKFQAWQFIDIFGNTSCGSYSPFSNDVYLEV